MHLRKHLKWVTGQSTSLLTKKNFLKTPWKRAVPCTSMYMLLMALFKEL